tara:strand:- start:186 stop:386 length:201 start_codon:yes stop_codon:yes gene_type:complete
LLDKDEYYGSLMPERGALRDSGTQISPMVVDEDINAYNPSLLSLESLGDRETLGNKTGKFSFRAGQ